MLSGRAFSYVELLVAISIGAAVITAAAIAFATITANRPSSLQQELVQVGSINLMSFYAITAEEVSVSRAPSYNSVAFASSLRDQLLADAASAVGIFCLPRNGPVATRPSTLGIPQTTDARSITNGASFRQLLPDLANYSASTSNAIRGNRSSLFILGPSLNPTNLVVRSIYETDLIVTTNPAGIYASVRRYVGNVNTAYYHVFYPDSANFFSPLAYLHRRDLANNVTRPFYLVWWPDPATRTLPSTHNLTDDTRQGYTNLAQATSLFFVLPMYPAL